ncbi:MAG: PIN domain-containing protein [Chitinispirillia bacterium]|nr:PIN domain-containing protein [Chitinispirillia bacterium]MCL2242785.1 PIN domain-containing protein [Chitinispirillia bacterium]
MAKLYFDSCMYGRHRDDQKDARIAAETIAIMTIIDTAPIVGNCILGSGAVVDELGRIKNPSLRTDLLDFYVDTVDVSVKLTPADDIRAQVFRAAGVGTTDSVHLAAAEKAGADYLLTVDDDFERVATAKNLSNVKVMNPLTYLAGGTK